MTSISARWPQYQPKRRRPASGACWHGRGQRTIPRRDRSEALATRRLVPPVWPSVRLGSDSEWPSSGVSVGSSPRTRHVSRDRKRQMPRRAQPSGRADRREIRRFLDNAPSTSGRIDARRRGACRPPPERPAGAFRAGRSGPAAACRAAIPLQDRNVQRDGSARQRGVPGSRGPRDSPRGRVLPFYPYWEHSEPLSSKVIGSYAEPHGGRWRTELRLVAADGRLLEQIAPPAITS